jgi:hypothetical protein
MATTGTCVVGDLTLKPCTNSISGVGNLTVAQDILLNNSVDVNVAKSSGNLNIVLRKSANNASNNILTIKSKADGTLGSTSSDNTGTVNIDAGTGGMNITSIGNNTLQTTTGYIWLYTPSNSATTNYITLQSGTTNGATCNINLNKQYATITAVSGGITFDTMNGATAAGSVQINTGFISNNTANRSTTITGYDTLVINGNYTRSCNIGAISFAATSDTIGGNYVVLRSGSTTGTTSSLTLGKQNITTVARTGIMTFDTNNTDNSNAGLFQIKTATFDLTNTSLVSASSAIVNVKQVSTTDPINTGGIYRGTITLTANNITTTQPFVGLTGKLRGCFYVIVESPENGGAFLTWHVIKTDSTSSAVGFSGPMSTGVYGEQLDVKWPAGSGPSLTHKVARTSGTTTANIIYTYRIVAT